MMGMNNIYVVIMAGGKGERLWPLSRALKPKQLLSVDNESLLQKTINRVNSITTKENIWIVTTQEQEFLIQEAVGTCVGTILAEPSSCNTAPAVLLSSLIIKNLCPNATILFLPADHYIHETQNFVETIQQAVDHAQKSNEMTLIGIKPTYPATGYGYISFNKNKKNNHAYTVKSFHEKPSIEKATEYISQDCMLWNSGMFCAPVDTFIQAYKNHAPIMYDTLENYLNKKGSYESSPAISFDYAILEHLNKISVIPATFTWSDVGNLETFLTLNTSEQKNVLALNADNSIVSVPHKLVVLIGVNDVCVVQTDDALLIAKRSDVEKVKEIVQLLKQSQKMEYL